MKDASAEIEDNDSKIHYELDHSYEQGDPGWYVCDTASGHVVAVIDDEIHLTEGQAEAVRGALEAWARDNPSALDGLVNGRPPLANDADG